MFLLAGLGKGRYDNAYGNKDVKPRNTGSKGFDLERHVKVDEADVNPSEEDGEIDGKPRVGPGEKDDRENKQVRERSQAIPLSERKRSREDDLNGKYYDNIQPE